MNSVTLEPQTLDGCFTCDSHSGDFTVSALGVSIDNHIIAYKNMVPQH